VLSYSNSVRDTDGGTHEKGFRRALRKSMSTFARRFGILRGKSKPFNDKNLGKGLTAIVSVMLPDPIFNNASKSRLFNPEAEDAVFKVVTDSLNRWLDPRPADADRICRRVARYSTANG
jgi:DNA gyrase subunit B